MLIEDAADCISLGVLVCTTVVCIRFMFGLECDVLCAFMCVVYL